MFSRHIVLLLLVTLVAAIEGSTKPTPARVPIKRVQHLVIDEGNEGYPFIATTSPANWTLKSGVKRGFVRFSLDHSRYDYDYHMEWVNENAIPNERINCHVLVRPDMIYEIENDQPRPWVNLSDGSDFTATWMTIKDGKLYVGSTGMGGSRDLVKVVSADGTVKTIDWSANYRRLRETAATFSYLYHEAVQWSEIHQKWFILPNEEANDASYHTRDAKRGSLMLKANEHFTHVSYKRYGTKHSPERRITAFAFFPGSYYQHNSMIMALTSTLSGSTSDSDECSNYVYIFDTADYSQAFDEILTPGDPDSPEHHGLYFL